MLTCARKGHVTYAPDEPSLRDRLMSPTAAGRSWRCLRCGLFISGEPSLTGPASGAPHVRRDRELRGVLILRFFAVERMARAVVVGGAALAIWRFRHSGATIEQAFDRELPRLRPFFRQLGYDLDHSRLVDPIRHAFTLKPATLGWIAAGLTAYTVIVVVEAVGLWLAKRWGEYFAMVATSAGLPLEIYELAHKITYLRAGAFLLNVALVVYLVYAKRLFGVRGGGTAYEARLRSESIIGAELNALAAAAAPAGGAAGRDRTGTSNLAGGSDRAGAAHADMFGGEAASGAASREASREASGADVAAPAGLTEATNSSAAE